MTEETRTCEELLEELETLRHRRTEDSLREQRKRLQVLFEEAPVGVTETDLDGHWIRVNRRFCEIVGYSRAELRGMRYQDLTHPEDLAEDDARARQVLAGEAPSFSLEKRYVRKDGAIIWVSLRVALIRDADGAPDYFIAMMRDVTERKEMEAQLRQHERLAAVGQLAAGIAHDFRNLLSIIILNAQLLQHASELSPKGESRLQSILDESDKATGLVQQILDFSGQTMLKMQALDLESLIREVAAMLRRTIPENIRIEVAADAGPHVIEADPARIQSALINLALNARDAMKRGGLLDFTLSAIEVRPGETPPVGEMRSGDWIRLTVADTGIGMTADVRSHLFEPFFTTKAVGEGTGLGLAQVFGIVQQHQGHIDVETAPGEGSAFHLYFPASGEGERRARPEPEEPAVNPRGRGETALLVEDEAKLRRVGRAVLESLGYRVETAANGREALALCQSPRWSQSPARQIDVVITDLVMPEMGGEVLLREMRRHHYDLPFIAITGYALNGDDLSALREAGFTEVIPKPVDVDVWARAIRRALDS
jgi:PAS domain S-box-containing protein